MFIAKHIMKKKLTHNTLYRLKSSTVIFNHIILLKLKIFKERLLFPKKNHRLYAKKNNKHFVIFF
jgi:hypothetical protein